MKLLFCFERYGELGIEISEFYFYVGVFVDEFCVICLMYILILNYEFGLFMMNSGN